MQSYEKESADQLDTDANGNVWLIRDGQRKGTIVGQSQETLYRLAEETSSLPSPRSLKKRRYYRISSDDDQAYFRSLRATKIGRKSHPIDSDWGVMGLQVQMEHTIYIYLPQPLQPNMLYHLTLPPGLDKNTIDFTYQPEKQVSSAIHVSQLGYRVDSTAKLAYLSLWAGNLGPIAFTTGTPFHIVEETSGEVVYSAEVELKKSLGDKDEDAYNFNYNGTNVYSLDFSAFSKPGTFHIFIEGIGRSPLFQINNDIWQHPLYHALRGFYHQRSGIEISLPYSEYQRPRSHHPDDGRHVLTSGARLMDTGNGFVEGLDNFSLLTQLATDIPLDNVWGGYYDAGDWDRRIQHLQVSRNLLDLYSQFPEYFNAFSLTLPESTNNIPDIIDESLWSLDFFSRLQAEDGSVRGGIEATGHPYFGEPGWLARRQLLAYHPGIWSTYLFAATSAQAARTLAQLAPERAENYRHRALRAMHKAEEMLLKEPDQPFQVRDARNLAAIELYKLTQAPVWHQIFIETSVFTDSGVPLYLYENHDQGEAAWSYIQTQAGHADLEIRDNCIHAVLSSADTLLGAQEKAGFSWMKNPWRPPFAGAFTIPFTRDVIWAWLLTGESRYLDAVELSIQSVHGANPRNLSYTTGLGERPVRHPSHPDSRISGQQTPPGITVLGPLDLNFIGEAKTELLTNYGSHCFPNLRRWPVMETYLDVFWFPLMNEFSIETMATQVYTIGFLSAFPSR